SKRDWSSDVCSSDLKNGVHEGNRTAENGDGQECTELVGDLLDGGGHPCAVRWRPADHRDRGHRHGGTEADPENPEPGEDHRVRIGVGAESNTACTDGA